MQIINRKNRNNKTVTPVEFTDKNFKRRGRK